MCRAWIGQTSLRARVSQELIVKTSASSFSSSSPQATAPATARGSERPLSALRLSPGDELELGRRLTECRQELVAIAAEPRTPSPGLRQRRLELEGEVDRIRERFLSANQGLVVHVVHRYLSMGLTHDDLMQEGNIGLMRAIDKYDHRRGRFGTYAVWWIRQGVRRALANQARMIRIPVHALGTRFSIEKAARRMAHQLGREPTPEELAATLGLPVRQVSDLLDLTKEPVSLDAPRGAESDARLGDGVADASAPDSLAQALGKQQTELAQRLLRLLTSREQGMLRMRFGLDGSDEYTLEEIGAAFAVTRERARQIIGAALVKLEGWTRLPLPALNRTPTLAGLPADGSFRAP
jgi:RNA polymerase primary sigma factor